MNKVQLITLAGAFFLFIGLYWGTGTKPKERKSVEKSRTLVAESIDIDELLRDAKKELTPEAGSEVALVESKYAASNSDTAKATVLKNLAHIWYDQHRIELSGHYAQKVAEIEGTEKAWFIAAATFREAAQKAANDKIRQFCSNRSLKAYESTLSLNPTSVPNKLNLAICYADNPPADNPMKGILMLRELNEQAPENVAVINTLGRLAIKTGQFDKAVARLEKAISLEPNNPISICLLAEAYENSNETAKAAEFAKKCKTSIDKTK